MGMPNYYQADRMYPYGEFPSYTTTYRPVEMQMAMRPSGLGMPELLHHHHLHQQPLVDHSQYIHSHPHQQHQAPPPPLQPTPVAMAYTQSEDEMAQLQELSAKFQPEVMVSSFASPHLPTFCCCTSFWTPLTDAFLLQGPFVGEKQLTRALVDEYAAADPIYRTKTSVCTIKQQCS
jgi:hypothetical protein